ncbi:MAG: bacillithiol biosynthesis deacetylase BshB1 [Clostridia bacterium]|nr:bacillithiol biosynthesis deacetylase BshB1 [Clostridia bacterium]
MEQVDILAIGAHPDDVEIGMGGTIAMHVSLGFKVGIIDLTRGELGTNGTPEQRIEEGEQAREILGCTFRVNLGLPDGGVLVAKENTALIVEQIRQARPTLVFSTFYEDKHPDHVACGKLVEEAFFISGLKKFATPSPSHKPEQLIFYMVNPQIKPSFIVDISKSYHIKKQAVLAHRSQFFREEGSTATELNKENGYPEPLAIRDKYIGLQIGAAYGEGFLIKNVLPVNNLFSQWGKES